MFKNLTFIVLLTLCANLSYAQSVLQVYNASNKKPLVNAAIYYKCTDSRCPITRNLMYTDSLGKCVINGIHEYNVEVMMIGYVRYKTILTPHQHKTIYLKENVNDLNEFVVTGQYEQTSAVKSIQKIKIIDSKRIEAQGSINLKDLLSNELNIRISQDNILGSGISIQGVSGANVKILIDGVPLIGRMNGNIDLSQINLNNIERIEIIEGPMSVAYGTDALGGVINLISKKKSAPKPTFGINSYVESVGQYNVDLLAAVAKNKHQLNLAGGRNFFNGYTSDAYYHSKIEPAIQDAKYNEYYLRNQQWLPKLQYFADVNYTYNLPKGTLSYQGSYFNELVINKGLPTITNYNAYAFDDYYRTTRLNNYVYFNYSFKNKAKLNLINAYSIYLREKSTYRTDLVTLAQEPIPVADDQSKVKFDSYNFRGTYGTMQHKKLNYQLGYDITLENGSGDKLRSDAFLADYAAFMSMDYKPINRVSFRPGIRFGHNSRYGSPVIPSLNLKCDLTASLALRASYSRGFRAPSLKELDLYFVDFNHSIVGNQNLLAETSNNYLMSISYRKVLTNDIFLFEPSLFYNNINNLISLALINPFTTPPLYTYVNINYFVSKGLSLQTEWKRKNTAISFGYSYMGRSNILAQTNPGLAAFGYSNEYRVNGSYSFAKIGVKTSLFYKFTGAMPGYSTDANNEVIQTRIGAYQMCDLTATKQFYKKVGLTIGAKNLFNTTNIQSTSTGGAVHGSDSSMPVSWGRTYFMAIKINL